jgi:predicted O-methyltransferase YrrM
MDNRKAMSGSISTPGNLIREGRAWRSVIARARSAVGLARFTALNIGRVARTPHAFAFLRYTWVVRDPNLMSDLQRAVLWTLACEQRVSGCVVELGAWMGGSTVCLAAASRLANAGPVYAVDTFAGADPDCEARVGRYGGSTWDRFQRNLQRAGVTGNVRVLRTTTMEASRAWSTREEGTIRLLFIDADHRYASVRGDFESWISHVTPGGVVAWHDYNDTHPGVVQAVDEALASGVVTNPGTVSGLLWAYKR